MDAPKILDTEIIDGALVLAPNRDVGELDFHQIEAEGAVALKMLDEHQLRNVIIDLEKAEFYGSTALGVLVRLHNKVVKRNGRMFVSGVSDHEAEVMRITKLDTLWTTCRTKQEALAAVRNSAT